MDPVTGAVVAIVVFLVSVPAVWMLTFALFGVLGAAVSDDLGFVGAAIGWLVGLAWGAFALIQIILQIIHLVGLLTPGTAV